MLRQRLVWIAEHPQGPRRMAEATYPGRVRHRAPHASGAARHHRGRALLQVGSGSDKLTTAHQGGPQGVVRLQQERRVVGLIRLRSCSPNVRAPVVLPTVVIKPPESPQHGKELGSLPTCPHNSCARVYACLSLRCCRALGDCQCRAQGGLAGAARRVRSGVSDGLEHLQPSVKCPMAST